MLGYIMQEANSRVYPYYICEEIAGMSFLVLHCGAVNTRRQERRFKRRVNQMMQQGIRRAIIPSSLMALCHEVGIKPISDVPLRHAMIGPLLDHFCRQEGLDIHQSTVRLCGHELNDTVRQAAVLLAHKARYMELDIKRGQEELSRWLRLTYGLSVGCVGKGAIMQICCDDVQAGKLPTLWLGKNCEKHQHVTYQLIEPWSREITAEPQLLCVLYEEKKLPIEAFAIKTVESHA